MTKRLGFLPIFFLCLGAAFAIAVYLRLSSYSTEDAGSRDGVGRGRSATATESAASASGRRRTGEMGTVSELDPGALGTLPPPELEATPEAVVAAKALREQRYQQLLNASTPSDAKTGALAGGRGRGDRPETTLGQAEDENGAEKTAKRESAVDKVLRPIANLFGNGSNSSRTSTPQTPQPHLPEPQPQTSNSQEDKPKNEPAKERDPNSDTAPPQLVSIGFSPTNVRDGEETTLVVVANDDLSGVRTISGSIISPSGGLQGFALQREGDSPRYSSRVLVAKDSPEGTWRVNYLNLADNASNTVALTAAGAGGAALSAATFTVSSSAPDATGPQLKAVWLSKPSMRAGEKNTVFVQAMDDKSGVNMVSGVFQSPAHFARMGFGCRIMSGDGLNGQWQCEISTPVCVDCGDWQLEQVQLQDKANNMTTVRVDNPAVQNVRVNVGGDSCDNQPPALETAVLDQNTVSNAEISTITMTVTVSDDACGVQSISGQAAGPTTEGGQPPRLYFSFNPTSPEATTWTAKIIVPKVAAKGMWNVAWMQILDKGNNLKTYSHADPQLANAVFRVQ